MFRYRRLPVIGLSVAAIAGLLIGPFDGMSSILKMPRSTADSAADSLMDADNRQQGRHDWGVPEQGRPAGRLRGGSSR